jgi:hypothetical protein
MVTGFDGQISARAGIAAAATARQSIVMRRTYLHMISSL